MKPYILKPHLVRRIKIYKKGDAAVPQELYSAQCVAPELDNFPYPLPSAKADYTCCVQGNNGVMWFGGKTGVTRYDPKAERKENVIMYFSAKRHLEYNEVDAMLADGDNVWVLTGDAVSHIQMVKMTCEEKAEILLDETLKYVMRRGMVSQRMMKDPRDIESVYPYADSDNDGSFTGGFAIGELYHYAFLREKLGEDHPRTVKAKQAAVISIEANLLLLYIHGRPEGFAARSYHVTGEPVPDDGMFYKRDGKVARAIETSESKKRGMAGYESPCDYPIPERLRHLLTDGGYTEDDVTYKADTSSDEITTHFVNMKLAHEILGPDDPELDAIIIDACKRTMNHIIDGGFEYRESNGKSTTWAKWSKDYFENDPTGYVDEPLNSGELLFYLKATMFITGEKGKWHRLYKKLVSEGYADVTTKHFERFYQGAMREKSAPEQELMYGDNMLALYTFWMLNVLEEDEELKAKYEKAFKSWSGLLLREHNPTYDFPYLIAVPDADINLARDADWFTRFEDTRIANSVVVGRHDVPVKKKRSTEGWSKEISGLLPPDERSINKCDRNPFCYEEADGQPQSLVENCYVYTMGYWMGRYYGIIDEEV